MKKLLLTISLVLAACSFEETSGVEYCNATHWCSWRTLSDDVRWDWMCDSEVDDGCIIECKN